MISGSNILLLAWNFNDVFSKFPTQKSFENIHQQFDRASLEMSSECPHQEIRNKKKTDHSNFHNFINFHTGLDYK